MLGAVGDDLPGLARHEVQQLVDQEGGREGVEPGWRDPDQLPTYRTPSHSQTVRLRTTHSKIPEPELSGVSGNYSLQQTVGTIDQTLLLPYLQAGDAHRVGARQQLRGVLRPVVSTF